MSQTEFDTAPKDPESAPLKRVLGPGLLLLFIVGDILGAGVYAAIREWRMADGLPLCQNVTVTFGCQATRTRRGELGRTNCESPRYTGNSQVVADSRQRSNNCQVVADCSKHFPDRTSREPANPSAANAMVIALPIIDIMSTKS